MSALGRLMCGMVAGIGLLACAGVQGAAEKPPPLLFKLEPGTIWTYEGDNTFDIEGGGQFLTTSKWAFHVIERRGDDKFVVVVRTESTFTSKQKDRKEPPGEPRVDWGLFEMSPRGEIHPVGRPNLMIVPEQVIPILPPADGPPEWTGVCEPEVKSIRYHISRKAGAAGGKVLIEGETDDLFGKIYEMKHTSFHTFDPAKGVVTLIEQENSQGWGFKGKGRGRIELRSEEVMSAGETGKFAAEIRAFFEIEAKANALLKETEAGGADAKKALEGAMAALKNGENAATIKTIRGAYADNLKTLESNKDYYLSKDDKKSEKLDKPSPEWETTDLDGAARKLSDFHGKVMVLDFWYRGCGWCIRAMPQIKQLAREFEGKPVAVLGMNTDNEEEDARFVIKAMELNYPTLKAEGLPEKYGVRGFPTLVIIDQSGVVRDFHVGYSPDLREKVSGKVRELLKESPSK